MTIWQKAGLALLAWLALSFLTAWIWSKLLEYRTKTTDNKWLTALLRAFYYEEQKPLVLFRDRDRPLALMSMNEREWWDDEIPFALDVETDNPKEAA
jgi:hypothetical protein